MKEIQQLHEDILCLCDGLDPLVKINTLANLVASLFYQYSVPKKELLDGISWLYDKHEEDLNE